jgi:hypothetical protein
VSLEGLRVVGIYIESPTLSSFNKQKAPTLKLMWGLK